jgi:hypothetical protein
MNPPADGSFRALGCQSEPFTVIPSEARNLALPLQGKLREESRSANKGFARFLASLSRKTPPTRDSRESGNPFVGLAWTPAYAGVTRPLIFIPLGGPQAHGHSE